MERNYSSVPFFLPTFAAGLLKQTKNNEKETTYDALPCCNHDDSMGYYE